MFGLFKKKIKDAVDKLTGKIEEDTESRDSEEVAEDVILDEEKEEKHTTENTRLGSEVRSDELRGEGTENKDFSEDKERCHQREEVPEVKDEEKKVKKEGILSKITRPITSKTLSSDFLDDILWEIEIALLENNVAQAVSLKIVADIKDKLVNQSVRKSEAERIIKDTMRNTIFEILNLDKVDIEEKIRDAKNEHRSLLILFLGFNGSGKTTSIGKMGNYLINKGHSCVFAAGDSFRAAAVEQLEVHGHNLGIKVIKQAYGTDPAAIIFDAQKHASARGINVVLADTAGRVHTDRNLIDELKKIVRVNKPDLKFLVIESIAGNDVVEQAKVFDEVELDGIILTKTDVDEKGGSALSLCYTLGKPVYFIGTGQEYSDFVEFDAEQAVKSIFD